MLPKRNECVTYFKYQSTLMHVIKCFIEHQKPVQVTLSNEIFSLLMLVILTFSRHSKFKQKTLTREVAYVVRRV